MHDLPSVASRRTPFHLISCQTSEPSTNLCLLHLILSSFSKGFILTSLDLKVTFVKAKHLYGVALVHVQIKLRCLLTFCGHFL